MTGTLRNNVTRYEASLVAQGQPASRTAAKRSFENSCWTWALCAIKFPWQLPCSETRFLYRKRRSGQPQ
jgi:hypothetical protein